MDHKTGKNPAKKRKKPTNVTKKDTSFYSRFASTEKYSAATLCQRIESSISDRQVQKVLNDSNQLMYKSISRSPFMNDTYRPEQLSMVKWYVRQEPTQWMRVIFLDEKKFNMDMLGEFVYWWHDLRR